METGEIRKATNGMLIKLHEKLENNFWIFYIISGKKKVYLKATEEKIKQNSKKARKKTS